MPKKKKKADNRCAVVGLTIKRLRTKRGLSQDKLSELADIHTSYIGQIECGLKSPSLKVLFRIADGLKVHPADLFADINGRKKS